MMAGVGDSEIGGHTQSTILYKVVPELSFNLKVENLRSSSLQGCSRSLIQGGKSSQLCDFSATKALPGFWTSSNLGMKAELSLLSC